MQPISAVHLPGHSTGFLCRWSRTETFVDLPSRGPQWCYSRNPKWKEREWLRYFNQIWPRYQMLCCLLLSQVLSLLTVCGSRLSMQFSHNTTVCEEKRWINREFMLSVISLQTPEIYWRPDVLGQTLSEWLCTFWGFWKLNEVRRFCPATMTLSGSRSRKSRTGAWLPGKGNLFIVVAVTK